MKMPNGQFSLWESEKLLGFGMCCVTPLCGFLIIFFLQSKECTIVERCSHLILFQACMDYRIFPFLFEEKYLYLVPVFITDLPQNSN